MVDLKQIQDTLDNLNIVDEYSIYDKFVPNAYMYKLSRDEYFNLCIANKRLKDESFEDYKIRRKKIEHYLKIKSIRGIYLSKQQGTLRKG